MQVVARFTSLIYFGFGTSNFKHAKKAKPAPTVYKRVGIGNCKKIRKYENTKIHTVY